MDKAKACIGKKEKVKWEKNSERKGKQDSKQKDNSNERPGTKIDQGQLTHYFKKKKRVEVNQ